MLNVTPTLVGIYLLSTSQSDSCTIILLPSPFPPLLSYLLKNYKSSEEPQVPELHKKPYHNLLEVLSQVCSRELLSVKYGRIDKNKNAS
jgi:hypothetical protein